MPSEPSVLQAAQSAWDCTAVYRELYGSRPEQLSGVPFIGHSQYHRARGVADCVRSLDQVCGTVPPFLRDVRRIPVTVAEDDTDGELRHKRTVMALRDAGLSGSGRADSVVLVADDATGPFACDLSGALGWERHPASVIYANTTPADLQQDLEAYRPDVVLWVTPFHRAADWAVGITCPIIEVRALQHPGVVDVPNGVLLVSDELHVVASRPAGRAWFAYDRSQLVAEMDPRSGLWGWTRLRWGAFPLVRYTLGVQRGLDLRGIDG